MFLLPFSHLGVKHMFSVLQLCIVLAFELMQVLFEGGELTLQLRLESVASIVHRRRFVTQNWKKKTADPISIMAIFMRSWPL